MIRVKRSLGILSLRGLFAVGFLATHSTFAQIEPPDVENVVAVGSGTEVGMQLGRGVQSFGVEPAIATDPRSGSSSRRGCSRVHPVDVGLDQGQEIRGEGRAGEGGHVLAVDEHR